MDSIIRPTKEGDIAELVGFFEKAYRPEHITTNRDYLAWQYRDAAASQFYPDYSDLLLFYKKAIVGHLGLIPYVFNVNGQKMRAAFLANGIIKKDLRGTGAGALLVKEAEKYFDILYTMGFNDQIAPIYKLSGWSEECFLKRWVLKHPKEAVNAGTQNIVEIDSFGEVWDASWEEMAKFFIITIGRSSKYLNWRFSNNPFIKYKIFGAKSGGKFVGYIVLRKEIGNEFSAYRIVDFISEEKAAGPLLSAAAGLAREERVDFVDFFCSSHRYGKELLKTGFELYDPLVDPEPPMLIMPSDRGLLKINFVYKLINSGLKNYAPEDWFVVKADGDKDRAW